MRRNWFVVLAAVAAAAIPASPASADGLNAYRVKATAENLRALAEQGFDVTEGRDLDRGTIDVVGTDGQAAKLDAKQLTDYTAAKAAKGIDDPTAGANDAAYTVWTKYDAVDGRRQGAVHRAVRPPRRRPPRRSSPSG